MKRTITSSLLILLVACAGGDGVDRADLGPALSSITSDGLMANIQTLASDAFEGRAPGTPGEDSTVAFLTAQFRALGLAPGNPDGSYVQQVEMIGYTGSSTASIKAGSSQLPSSATRGRGRPPSGSI